MLSYDIKNKQLVQNEVEELITHYGSSNGYLVINESLKITPNHPVWSVDEKKWRQIGDLALQTKLLNNKGEDIVIASIRENAGIYDVYNVHLKNSNHNFFADDILVHNATMLPAPSGKCA